MYNSVANVFVTIICALTLLCVRSRITVFSIKLFVVPLSESHPPLSVSLSLSLHVLSVV